MTTPRLSSCRPNLGTALAAASLLGLSLNTVGCETTPTRSLLATAGAVGGAIIGSKHGHKIGMDKKEGAILGAALGGAVAVITYEATQRPATVEEVAQAESRIETIREQRTEQGLEDQGEALVRLDETRFIKIDLDDGIVTDPTVYEISAEDGMKVQDQQAINLGDEDLLVYS